jgi:hypothetical protein
MTVPVLTLMVLLVAFAAEVGWLTPRASQSDPLPVLTANRARAR